MSMCCAVNRIRNSMHTRLESGSLRNMKEAYHQGRRHMLLFHALLAVSALLRDTATQQNTQNNFPRARKKTRGWGWGGCASSFHLQVIQLSRLSTGCDPRPVDSHGRDGARCVEGASLFQSQCRAIPIYMLSGCVECTGAPTPLLQKLECPCRQDGGGVVSNLSMCSEAFFGGRVLKKRT